MGMCERVCGKLGQRSEWKRGISRRERLRTGMPDPGSRVVSHENITLGRSANTGTVKEKPGQRGRSSCGPRYDRCVGMDPSFVGNWVRQSHLRGGGLFVLFDRCRNSPLPCAHAPIPPRVPGTCLPLGGCGASFAQRNAQHAIALGDLGERANHWHLARVLAYNASRAVGAECSDGLAVGRWPSAGESTSPRAFRLLFVVSLRFCFSPA